MALWWLWVALGGFVPCRKRTISAAARTGAAKMPQACPNSSGPSAKSSRANSQGDGVCLPVAISGFFAPGGGAIRIFIKASTVDSAFLQADRNRADSVEVRFDA